MRPILALLALLLAGCDAVSDPGIGDTDRDGTSDTDFADTEVLDTDVDIDTDAVDTDVLDTGVVDTDTLIIDPNDRDGDGSPAEIDCDDQDPGVGSPSVPYTLDGDGDHYGAEGGQVLTACTLPADYLGSTDCNDGDAVVHPSADEVCDATDNDCDGGVDEDAVDAPTWYDDYDGDGYGGDQSARVACEAPPGTVGVGGDCAEFDGQVYPSAPEVCDGVRNDCALHSWNDSLEDGLVTLLAEDGTTWTDNTTGFGGDIVLQTGVYTFCRGTWHVHLHAPQDVSSVVLNGQYGAEETVLDGDGAGRTLEAANPRVTIDGLSLIGGGSSGKGGAVSMTGGGTLVLDHALVRWSSSVAGGGGVYVDASSVVGVHHSEISGCQSDGRGGGLLSEGSAELDDVLFQDDQAGAEGGGFAFVQGQIQLHDVEVSNSTAIGSGGGGFIEGGIDPILTNLRFYGNAALPRNGNAVEGGGLAIFDASLRGLRLDAITASGNTAVGHGGGVFVSTTGPTTLVHFDLADNRADYGGDLAVAVGQDVDLALDFAGSTLQKGHAKLGGGLYIVSGGGAQVHLSGGTLQDNEATAEGGGLYAVGGDLTIDSTLLSGNLVGSSGSMYGGGASLREVQSHLIDARLVDNGPKTPGDKLYGGGLSIMHGAFDAQGTTFSGNAAFLGGGLYYNSLGTSPGHLQQGCYVMHNVAAYGGGVFVDAGELDLADSFVLDNDAGEGGGGGLGVFGEFGSVLVRVTACSFGTVLHVDDNTAGGLVGGADVANIAGTFAYGDNVSFMCDGWGGCL